MTLTGTLEWREEWLLVAMGPWRFAVADVEVFHDGTARAHLHGWFNRKSAICMEQVPEDLDDHHHIADDHRNWIDCDSVAEAAAVIRALLALRGIEAPEWRKT